MATATPLAHRIPPGWPPLRPARITMNVSTPAPEAFRFLDHPSELRLIIYEFLPVTRIHRKINKSLTLVVIWSPASVLRVSHLVKEEPSTIVKGTVEVYKQTRGECDFETHDRNPMPKMIIRNLDSWNARDDCGSIPSLVRSALEWEAFFNSRDLPDDHATKSYLPQSTQNDSTWRPMIEWVRHAAELLNQTPIRLFDIAVPMPSDEQYETVSSQEELFYIPSPNDTGSLSDMVRMMNEKIMLSVNSIIVPPDLIGGKPGCLADTIEHISGCNIYGCCLEPNEWELRVEEEWL